MTVNVCHYRPGQENDGKHRSSPVRIHIMTENVGHYRLGARERRQTLVIIGSGPENDSKCRSLPACGQRMTTNLGHFRRGDRE
ncbi:hypothetical protein DPMN_060392 [Dreissena polymorpha]|uniref:Uncharacterized protein n=2 Tax=Dreissena polymorpha TaxID=45954 RepID=A0A9D4C5W9_DREPO|nr:hypothetical protein DPMN_060392 [Dreissena polymorpha]